MSGTTKALRRPFKVTLSDVRNEESQAQEVRTPAWQEEAAGKSVIIVLVGIIGKPERFSYGRFPMVWEDVSVALTGSEEPNRPSRMHLLWGVRSNPCRDRCGGGKTTD